MCYAQVAVAEQLLRFQHFSHYETLFHSMLSCFADAIWHVLLDAVGECLSSKRHGEAP